MTKDSKRLRSIEAEIKHQEQRLADLDAERARLQERLADLNALRSQLSSRLPEIEPAKTNTTDDNVPKTRQEKLGLFGILFKGREDVFPLKFISKKTGKSGYAPQCSNKFVPGVCGLPRVKCGECSNQAFLPADDRALLDHLQGRQVMGVYPLLEDETCRFLAVDFDKNTWQEDVAAFRRTCQAKNISCAVERSQSGEGAHVWFFFSSPVPAALARQMGSYLITETMSVRHQLSMTSYDRLFPSQDTMPRGGFGNLIALPLQYESRKQGNTLFVDESFEPYDDQWAYLASLPRLSPSFVKSLTSEAVRTGRVLGVRPPELDADKKEDQPWRRPPAGWQESVAIVEPLPGEIKAVLAQKLFIDTEGISSALISRIKRLAAFQNPEFYKKQRMRLSTALTPRVIVRAEYDGTYLALPRGCIRDLRTLLEQHGIGLSIQDERVDGKAIEVDFKGELTQLQQDSADTLLRDDYGILVAPPGFGKTVIGAYLIANRRCSTLVLVHRQILMEQWAAQLALFLDIEEKKIGRLGAGKKRLNGCLDVATIQSLVRKDRVDDCVAEYGQVIVDECHHVPAVSFERVLSEVKARYVTGLTATPRRRDGHHPILEMQLGPPSVTIDARREAAKRPFEHRVITRATTFNLSPEFENAGIQDIYRTLVNDRERNELILNDVIAVIEEGRNPLLLTERKDHLAFLAERLSGFVRNLVVCQGGVRNRKAVKEQLAAIPDEEERLVLATGRYVGEGFDDRRLDTLFLTMPVAWKGVVTQYAGRLHRHSGNKREVRIYDYVDARVPTLERMYEKRLRAYRAMGYTFTETQQVK